MERVEDRSTPKYKAQEQEFYSNCQINNSAMDSYEKDMNSNYLSEDEKAYAKKKYEEAKARKQDDIDKWKEEHGAYDEEKTEERIGGKKKDEGKEKEQEQGKGM